MCVIIVLWFLVETSWATLIPTKISPPSMNPPEVPCPQSVTHSSSRYVLLKDCGIPNLTCSIFSHAWVKFLQQKTFAEEERRPPFSPPISDTVSFHFNLCAFGEKERWAFYSPLASSSLSCMVSSVGGRGEQCEGGRESEREGELEMTDNSGELRELQRGCGSGRWGDAVLQLYTKHHPLSPHLSFSFVFLFSLLLLPSPSLLSSLFFHVWFVFKPTEVLCA